MTAVPVAVSALAGGTVEDRTLVEVAGRLANVTTPADLDDPTTARLHDGDSCCRLQFSSFLAADLGALLDDGQRVQAVGIVDAVAGHILVTSAEAAVAA